jgi:hypothetical protein
LARVAVAALTAYKRWLSPLLPRACRFTPTCSEYALEAVVKYGFWRGGGRALGVSICHSSTLADDPGRGC